jgi:tripartite-type tricarboxylate transporter receptor subunit TctC
MAQPRLIAIAIVAAVVCASSHANSADWPVKPIRLIVPSSAGGAADLMARTFANALAPALGQQFIIDNRPGAGGAIATESVVRTEADGYTLMVSGLPYHVLGPAMNPNVSFDPIRDFTHIAFFGGSPMVLAVHPTLGVNSFAQLSALAATSKTGIDYVSPGFGTVGHLVGEYASVRAKLNLRHVPYKGGAAAITDLVAGHIKVGSLTWSTALPHIRAGALVPLAISTAQRLSEFPDLPTLAELGFGDIVVTAWFSLSGPPGLPRPIVERLNGLVNEAMTYPEVRKSLERDASESRPMSVEEFTAFLRSEADKWTPVIRTFAPAK